MVDITHKVSTLRQATALAEVVVGDLSVIQAIEEGRVPKGDVFEMSKAAGLLGVKKTPELLPDCHPLPIEYTGFKFSIADCCIQIRCTVKTIYKTGVEVEAMHGASIAALNMYDMLKPLDKKVSIRNISLVEKIGGKSSFPTFSGKRKAAVVVCSDSIAKGEGEDKAGKALMEILSQASLAMEPITLIPDEVKMIRNQCKTLQNKGVDLIVFCGGTGVSPRDVTPETLLPLLEKRLWGVEEAIRAYGQQRTPVAMFSRSLAGIMGNSVVLALPGSTAGASQSLTAIFPHLLHLFDVLNGSKH